MEPFTGLEHLVTMAMLPGSISPKTLFCPKMDIIRMTLNKDGSFRTKVRLVMQHVQE